MTSETPVPDIRDGSLHARVEDLLHVTTDPYEIRVRLGDLLTASYPEVGASILAAIGAATACAARPDVSRLPEATIIVVDTEAASEWVYPDALVREMRDAQTKAEAVAAAPTAALRERYAALLGEMSDDERAAELGALGVWGAA